MPTLKLKLECDAKPDQQKLNQLREIIASFDHDLVLFDVEYSENTEIDWDEYVSQFNSMSA